MSARHKSADCDTWHDSDTDVSAVRDLNPAEARVARILGWPRRLSNDRYRIVQELALLERETS